jgi:prepilin-type N-terminal cleavage/methylation domain-containing protein
MKRRHHTLCAAASQGFSLIEMAIVLLILGTLMGGVLLAVSQTMENNRRSAALAQLRLIEEALYGYAQVHKYLPCPATDSSQGRAEPDNGSACSQAHGFVPAATLNLAGAVNSAGLLLDPWQNPLRYSVAANGGAYEFNQPASLLARFMAGTFAADMLRVCSDTACSEVIAGAVPAIVYSLGANQATSTAAAELENTDNDTDFVSTAYSEANFDDLLIWLSPYTLYQRLISTKAFP